MQYLVIRLTSRPLQKRKYSVDDILSSKTPSESRLESLTYSDSQKQSNTEIELLHKDDLEQQAISNVLKEAHSDVISEAPVFIEAEELKEDYPEKKKFKLPKRRKKQKEEKSENKKRFTIWEEIPEEPRDALQLEAAELINTDGYYNTILPLDADDREETKSTFNWKVPAAILGGVLVIGLTFYLLFLM